MRLKFDPSIINRGHLGRGEARCYERAAENAG